MYDFIWSELCDWYIELVKPRLYGRTDPEDRRVAQQVLVTVLKGAMKLLHPFMPFITEEIWQRLPRAGETIMLAKWPTPDDGPGDDEAEQKMHSIMEVTRGIRNIRGEMNVPPGKTAQAIAVASTPAIRQALEEGKEYIEGLAGVDLDICASLQEKPEQAAAAVAKGVDIFVPLKGLIDVDREVARLKKELAAVEKDLAKVRNKLSNEAFLTKAPDEIVAKEKGKEEELSGKAKTLQERLAMFDAL